MTREEILYELQGKQEMDPDEHDGSYELVRSIIEAYSKLENFNNITYLDLDAIYLLAVGTWKCNVEKKKEKINSGVLPDIEKKKMAQLLDRVWDSACLGKYENKEAKTEGVPSIGMFGTGFMSFKGKTTDQCAKDFIEMCVDILKYENDEEIFARAEKVVNSEFKGMQAASVSVILHCLKPKVFPILNGNMGRGSIFPLLNVSINQPAEISTYITNCRLIREFRDANFSFKNYRIMDLMAREVDGDNLDEEEILDNMEQGKKDFEHNLILYGPPGTGKTYNTAIYAVAICDNKSLDELTDYEAVLARYNELRKQNRIAFTTFHQSYGYEEFIEGIKPVMNDDSQENSDVSYSVESGVFKKFCEVACTPADVEVDPNASIWFMRLDDNAKSIKDICFSQDTLIINIIEGDEWDHERFVDGMKMGDYILSYAGSSVYIDAVGIVEGEAICDESKESFQWSRRVKWTVFNDKVNVKEINNNKYLPNFSIAKMNHMKVSDLLRLLPGVNKSDTKPYVFIIDEINRGNISKIFGELITLIEDSKRLGNKEEISCKLPYSGQLFGVPNNVYILGTMNTADRSIALMDTALRRRFSFVEMMPKPDVLANLGITSITNGTVSLDVPQMLSVINKRVEFLFDREHTIGHAFFTGLKDDNSLYKLGEIFRKNVIPLLQEYFYEDYEKIQLVLGDNKKSKDDYKFILRKEESAKSIFNGNPELDAMYTYIVNPEAFKHLESYAEIYEETGAN